MRLKKNSSTPKQWAYARNKVGGTANTKQELARLSGYAPTTAKSPTTAVERSRGYKNALNELALQSNSLLLKVFAEMDRRDMEEFSNKDIITAINAITNAWAKIDTQVQSRINDNKNPDKNPLRSLFMQRSGVIVVPESKIKDVEVEEEDEATKETRKVIERMKMIEELDL